MKPSPGLLLTLVSLFCSAMAWPAFADDGRHLFILSGQSNMRQPLPDSFQSCVEAVFGKDKVIVVTHAHPSQPIKRWYKAWQPPEGMTDDKPQENGTLYDALLAKVNQAVGDKPIATVTYIWMQGEADANNSWASVYEKSFLGVLDQFKQDLDINRIHFVVGRINDFWIQKPDGEKVRAVQQALGEAHAHGDWIDTDDLNRGVNPWGGYSFDDGHFPPPGYRVMGQRFAHKACLLIDPQIELDPAVFEEAFFDSADDIKTHAGVGTLVIMKVPGDEQGKAVNVPTMLSDGKFGAARLGEGAWLGLPATESPYEITVDLGEPMPIDTVGVNTLITSKAKAQFPDKFVFSTSLDGKTFQLNNQRYNTVQFYNRKLLNQMRSDGIKPQALLLLTEQRTRAGKVKARYVKVQVHTGDQWVYLDEIIVNPSAKSDEPK